MRIFIKKTKDWICNNPTVEEVRFNDDSDVISSDNSETESCLSKPAKCNQLPPKAKTISKLLSSVRPKGNSIWKAVECSVHCQENYNTDSNMHTVLSDKMVKSKNKRIREADTSDEDEISQPKKIKTNSDYSVHKKKDHKEHAHSISSSESEGSARKSTKRKHKKHDSVKPNRNENNGHLLSSESEVENDLEDIQQGDISDRTFSENREVINNDSESGHVSQDSVQTYKNTKKHTKSDAKSLHRVPSFTPELNEEISKFSFLLNGDLIEKNDIWLLQCPNDMDCSALINQRLSLGGSCQLNSGQQIYETYSYRNTNTSRSATLAVPSEHNHLKLRRIPITGNIIVEESVSIVEDSSKIISEPPDRVEFPNNLRTRHPLLGIDFSKQPRTADRIPGKIQKKKKHSKRHDKHLKGVPDVSESEFNSSNFEPPKKKKKKHSKEEFSDIGAVSVSELDSTSTVTSVKKKRKKKDRSSEEFAQSDSEKNAIQESLEDSTFKKKKKKKHKGNESFYLND